MAATPRVREWRSLTVESGVSAFTGQAFCPVTIVLSNGDRVVGQLSPTEVRTMALGWLEAAEAAESDAAVFAAVKEMTGDENAAGVMLVEIRKRRMP